MKNRPIQFNRLLLLSITVLSLSGCTRVVQPDHQNEAVRLGLNHDLHGKIYDVREQRFITEQTLFSQVAGTPYLLLGEKHDNAQHHTLHAKIIRGLAAPDAVLLEMLSLDKQDRVHKTVSESEFQSASDWDKSGWPKYVLYQPKIKAIYEHQLKPGAANPTRVDVFTKMKDGSKEHALGPELQTRLKADLDRAHCGHLNGAMIEMMARAQTFKDQTMASSLIKQAGGGRAILIAGNGHIRKDYGVPKFLKSSVSIGFIEIKHTLNDPKTYESNVYDYMWFTARVDNEDPCKKFEKQLKMMKQKSHHTKP